MDDDDRSYETRVRDYVETFGAAGPLLPLTHAAALSTFRKIATGDSIMPQQCDRMGDTLTYLFYGKPAYRTPSVPSEKLSWGAPIVFVIDPNIALDIKRVVPFDSGAFVDGMYGNIFPKDSNLQMFELEKNLDGAQKCVTAFYGDNSAYFSGLSPKNERFSDFDFELQGIQFLANRVGEITSSGKIIDERSSSIEIQIISDILIARYVKYLLIPDTLLLSKLFWRAADVWGLDRDRIETYYRVSGPGPGAWYGQMYAKLKEIYKRDGVLMDVI